MISTEQNVAQNANRSSERIIFSVNKNTLATSTAKIDVTITDVIVVFFIAVESLKLSTINN